MQKQVTLKMEGGRLEIMDYLKGFAILTIALMHLLSFISAMPSGIITLSAVGGTGVHVFFLCSGAGLYLSYLKRPMGYAEFLKKRFWKIYIPYIAVVLVSFFVPWMYEGNDRVGALLSHVFLYKMFVPGYEESFGVQFWFISTIIQLYLLFIPMCRLKAKWKDSRIFAGVFFLISAAWWIVCYVLGVGESRVWNSFCLQYIWEFALGFVAAEALYRGKSFHLGNGRLMVLAVAGLGLQAGSAMVSDSLKVFNDVPALVGYTSLALLLSHIAVVRKWAAGLSGFSYEFYLLHMLVFTLAFHGIRPQGMPAQCGAALGAFVIALVLSCYYHKLIAKTQRLLLKRA